MPHICVSELEETTVKFKSQYKNLIQENAFENIVGEMAAILSGGDELRFYCRFSAYVSIIAKRHDSLVWIYRRQQDESA